MSITAQLPLLKGYTDAGTRLFMKLSQKAVANLNYRMKKKGFKGRLSLQAGRDALLAALGAPCRYCRKVIKIATMSLDHPMPIARGGDPYTVECICVDCNHEKSDIPAEEFQKLCSFVRTLSPETQASIHKALKGGAAYVRLLTKNKAMIMMHKREGNHDAKPDQAGDVHNA